MASIQNTPMNRDVREPEFDAISADPEMARAYLEALRWPHGAVCPHCGSLAGGWRIRRSRVRAGHVPGSGLWKCAACRRQFTATVGTMLENSKVPPEKWLMAFGLLCRDASGASSGQLARALGLTTKSALSMSRRIRYGLGFDPLRALWAASARARAAELAASGYRNSREFHHIRAVLTVSRKRPAIEWPALTRDAREVPPLTLWPMRPGEAMAAFLRVNPRSLPGE